MTQPYGQQPDPSGGGYPQGGDPQGYPQTPGQGQPAQGYPQSPPYGQPAQPQPYGSMPAAPAEYSSGPIPRPGTVTAAAVLAYVQAGITLIPTVIFIAAILDVDAAGGDAAQLWIAIVAQVIGSALLIGGGVQIMGGKSRTLMLAGTAFELAICLYWVIMVVIASDGVEGAEYGLGFVVAAAIFFAIMPVISLIMALGASTTQFLQSRRGH